MFVQLSNCTLSFSLTLTSVLIADYSVNYKKFSHPSSSLGSAKFLQGKHSMNLIRHLMVPGRNLLI